jgi:hypothetical protein
MYLPDVSQGPRRSQNRHATPKVVILSGAKNPRIVFCRATTAPEILSSPPTSAKPPNKLKTKDLQK